VYAVPSELHNGLAIALSMLRHCAIGGGQKVDEGVVVTVAAVQPARPPVRVKKKYNKIVAYF